MEEHRDGWTVLFRELNARRPLAEQVAQLRARVVAEVRRMLEGGASSWAGIAPPASEGVAEAIVGAGESLANWWLKHPTCRARRRRVVRRVGPGGDQRRVPTTSIP